MGTEQSRERRNISIRSAVAMSLVSKGGFALLQLVSVPLAVRILGMESFGLYASIAFAIQLVMVFQFGVGPALTHGISTAVANGDRETEKTFYATAFYLLLGLTVLAGIACSAIVLTVPLTTLFGDGYAGREAEMMPAIWLAIAFVLAKFMLSQTERMREGYLEVKINNAWGAFGNLLGAMTLGIGVFYFESIVFIMVAVHGTNLLVRLGNTIHLLTTRRYLIPSWSRFDRGLAKRLLKDGVAFGTTDMIPPLVSYSGCSLIAAHLGGPATVAVFHILMQLVNHLKGFVVMFTLPTWPAVADAFARGDIGWVRGASRKLLGFVFGYGLLVVAGFTLIGPIALPFWYGAEFVPGRLLLLLFSLYFLVSAWSYSAKCMLVGVGEVRFCAWVVLVEALVLLVPALVGMKLFGLEGIAASLAATTLLISGWLFPRRLHERLRQDPSLGEDSRELSPRTLRQLGSSLSNRANDGLIGRMRRRARR